MHVLSDGSADKHCSETWNVDRSMARTVSGCASGWSSTASPVMPLRRHECRGSRAGAATHRAMSSWTMARGGDLGHFWRARITAMCMCKRAAHACLSSGTAQDGESPAGGRPQRRARKTSYKYEDVYEGIDVSLLSRQPAWSGAKCTPRDGTCISRCFALILPSSFGPCPYGGGMRVLCKSSEAVCPSSVALQDSDDDNDYNEGDDDDDDRPRKASRCGRAERLRACKTHVRAEGPEEEDDAREAVQAIRAAAVAPCVCSVASARADVRPQTSTPRTLRAACASGRCRTTRRA